MTVAGAELPAALSATTLATYSVPFVSPVIVQLVPVEAHPWDVGMVVTR